MNLGTRAILYTVRKWKKTLLLFCLLLSIATLVLSGLAIADAQEEQAEEVRGTTGASFTVERDVSTGGWSNGSGGTYSTQEFISGEMMRTISKVDGIKGYNAARNTILTLYDADGNYLIGTDISGWDEIDSYYWTYGSVDSQYASLFTSGTFVLTEGKHVTSAGNGILLSTDIAKKHNLKVGDTLKACNNPDSNDPVLEVEIAGFFEVIADKDDEINAYNGASYFDYSNYAFVSMETAEKLLVNYSDEGIERVDFFVSDPEQLETIIRNVQNISSINWNNYKIIANDEVYQNISSSLSDTGTLITTLIVVITVVSMVLIILILSMSIRSRKREMGILLAVGIAKPAVIMQYVLETALIAVIAFPLAYLLSRRLAGTLGTLFGKTTENVMVTPQHFTLVAVVGGILLIVAVMVSCIPAMRFKPKQILSQME